MTAEAGEKSQEEVKNPTSRVLLGRLPDVPHIGIGSYKQKDIGSLGVTLHLRRKEESEQEKKQTG